MATYDRQSKRFSGFVLTRISNVKGLDEAVKAHERIVADGQWNWRADLRLEPHPGLQRPEAVIADYGMKGGSLRK